MSRADIQTVAEQEFVLGGSRLLRAPADDDLGGAYCICALCFVLKDAQLTWHQNLLVCTVGIANQFKGFGQHCCDVLFNHAYISR